MKNLTKKRAKAKPAKKEMSFRVASLLVYTIGVKYHGLDPSVEYAPEQVFSLSENAATKILKANMNDLIRHTHSHLVRVYPKGTRVGSSNYHPHRYWAGGCQVIALNWQTVGKLYRPCGFFCLLTLLRHGICYESGHVSEEWSLRLRPQA